MNDKAVIKAFVAYLARNGQPDLEVGSHPDEKERNLQAIDAVAGRLAIEHFTIDTLKGQREAKEPFLESIGCLEGQALVPFNLTICVGWGAIKRGQTYAATCEAVRRWIIEDSPQLPWGQHEIDAVPGVPFKLTVWKNRNMDAGVFVGRSAGPDDTLSDRLQGLIERKAKKLGLWRSHTRVLLIESNDIVLMNHVKLWDALRRGYPNSLPTGADEIWYADTCGRTPRFLKMTHETGISPAEALGSGPHA